MKTLQHFFPLALPLFSALLLSLTLPFANLGFLAWVSLVPLLVYITRSDVSPKMAALAGLLVGTIYGVSVLFPLASLDGWWWLYPEGFIWEYRVYVFSFFLLLVAFITGGGFFALFSWLYKKYRRGNLFDILIFPIMWALMEYGREFLVLGFPWGELGYSIHENLFLLQWAKLFGVYGISALIVSVNILALQSIRSFGKGAGLWGGFCRILRTRAFLALAILLATTHVFGYFMLHRGTAATAAEELPVAIIHPELTTRESAGLAGFELYLSLLSQALEKNAALIILPENTFPFFTLDPETGVPVGYDLNDARIGELYDRFLAVSESSPKTAFVVGMHIKAGEGKRNAMVVFEDGRIKHTYSKRELLLIFEKTPKIFGQSTTENFIAGPPNQHFLVGTVPVVPLICSEILYSALSGAEEGAFIINISNDSVFKSGLVGKQNHIIAKFRAVENGKFMLRAVKGGISSIIDPRGNVLMKKEHGAGVLFSTIQLQRDVQER